MEKYKNLYKNNVFIILVPKFNLLGGSYSISYIQDCFEYIIKLHQAFADNRKIQIYINKIEIRITSEIKNGLYL